MSEGGGAMVAEDGAHAAEERQQQNRSRNMKGSGASGAVYGLGFIGALIYFLQHAASFWAGVLGFAKALVWPAVLVYELMKFLKL